MKRYYQYSPEIQKFAASIEELAQGAARLKGVLKPTLRKNTKIYELAKINPFLQMVGKHNSGIKELLAMGGIQTVPQSQEIIKALKKQRLIDAGVPQSTIDMISDQVGMPDSLLGKIITPAKSGGPTGFFGAEPALKYITEGLKGNPGAQKGFNASVLLHEGFERAAARDSSPEDVGKLLFISHLSPDVILKEHNLISRLTGPGAEKVREAFIKMRTPGRKSEGPFLEELIKQLYGDKFHFEYGKSGRIPKAMRKDILRQIKQKNISLPSMMDPSTSARPDWETVVKRQLKIEKIQEQMARERELAAANKVKTKVKSELDPAARASNPNSAIEKIRENTRRAQQLAELERATREQAARGQATARKQTASSQQKTKTRRALETFTSPQSSSPFPLIDILRKFNN